MKLLFQVASIKSQAENSELLEDKQFWEGWTVMSPIFLVKFNNIMGQRNNKFYNLNCNNKQREHNIIIIAKKE